MIELVIFLFLICLGLVAGTINEKSHIRNLDLREQDQSDILITQLKTFPARVPGDQPPKMFTGEVSIATDYLKSFLASLKNLLGGEVKSYQTLQTRARREALMRLVEQARDEGYNAICNVRLETADVGGNSTLKKTAMVSIIASGTAYHADN